MILKKKEKHSFSCAQLPTDKTHYFIEWHDLTNKTPSSGIRGLLEGRSICLKDINEKNMQALKNTKIVAVILINTEDDYNTTNEFVYKLREEKFPIPFFIVTKGDGKALTDYEEKYRGKIQARVESQGDELPDGRKYKIC